MTNYKFLDLLQVTKSVIPTANDAPLQSHHQQLGLQQQPNLLQQDVQQRLQASGQVTGFLLPPQNVVDQQRQLYQS